MYYELLLMEKVKILLKRNVLLSDLELNDLQNILKVKPTKSLNINIIEAKIKEIIDELVLEYGMLDILKRLFLILRDGHRYKERFYGSTTYYDINHFLMASRYLYIEIEKYFSINIYLKIYSLVGKITNKKFDETAFYSYILSESISRERVLGIKPSEISQTCLYGQDEDIQPLSSILNARQFKTKVSSRIKKALYSAFTKKEIFDAINTILELLSKSSLLEHKIIKQLIESDIKQYILKNNEPPIQNKNGNSEISQLPIKGYYIKKKNTQQKKDQ